MLDQIAEERDDNATFAWLSKNMPEGLTMITEEEQVEFEKWLGI